MSWKLAAMTELQQSSFFISLILSYINTWCTGYASHGLDYIVEKQSRKVKKVNDFESFTLLPYKLGSQKNVGFRVS